MANALDRVKAAEAKYTAMAGTAEKLESTLKNFKGTADLCYAAMRELHREIKKDQKDQPWGFLVVCVDGLDRGRGRGFPWEFSTGGGYARARCSGGLVGKLMQISAPELEIVVELSPGGATKTAVFENLAGAPIDRVRQACGDVEVASAQHQYIFPQFAFGGGWESTLMVQALDGNTTCTFLAQDRSFTMRDPYGNNLSGTQQQLILGMNGWTILKTATPQGMAASSGMAVLDCDEEVSANTLFSLEVGGSLVAEALVESSEEIVSGEPAAQFLADHRDGARFAVAVANPSNQLLDVLIAVGDLGGQQIGEVTVNVPANAAQAFFVDELVTIPIGHTGQVSIRPSNNPGPSAYVVGLRVTGLVITTIPATVVHLTTATPDTPAALWSHSGSGNSVFDIPSHITRVHIRGTWSGSGRLAAIGGHREAIPDLERR